MGTSQHRPAGPAPRERSASRKGHLHRLLLAARPRRWAPLLLLGLGACDALPTGPGEGRIAFDEAPALSREATERINEHRASLGCGPLRWHDRSAAVGEQYAKRMNDAAFFGHVDPAGSTLKSRLNRAGIFGYRVAAETIAAGQRTATKVVGDWILSPEHRAILEDCRYTHVGIGFYTGEGPYRAYWTAVFLAAP
jgi:uncharacterized protein YkwD